MGPDVCNAAEGGACAPDLVPQAAKAGVEEDDLVVFSVGTNDAAPWKQVPVTAYAQAVRCCLRAVPARRWIYVAPPGVDESRLSGSHRRTNAVLDEYRDAAASVCNEAGARVVRTERVVGPLGADAFVSDRLHLSGRAYKVVLAAIADAAQATA